MLNFRLIRHLYLFTIVAQEGSTLFRSTLRFQVNIWHEGDIAPFLNTLVQEAKGGLLVPKTCVVSTIEVPDENAPSLRLDCQVAILTTEDR